MTIIDPRSPAGAAIIKASATMRPTTQDDPPPRQTPDHVPLSQPVPLLPLVIGPTDPIVFFPINEEPLDVRYMDGRSWRLLAEFDFASQVLERIIRCPKDETSDFATRGGR